MIYFDNAATTFPKPPEVLQAVQDGMVRYGANPGRSGHDLSVDTAKQVYAARENLAEFFGANDVEDVVFTSNCTHATNLAIKGALNAGDHVIISDLEHNAVARPIHTLSERGMITYDIAVTSLEDDDQTVRAFEALIRPNTKLIICTHASNVFGVKMPIEALAKMAKKHGVWFMVDAAQTAGVEPINCKEMGIDFLCMAGHKGLYGPSGTGVLITPHGAKLNTIVEGGTGSRSFEMVQPDFMPDRLECGTINTSGIIGLNAGINFIRQEGMLLVRQHEIHVANYIYGTLLKEPHVILYTDKQQFFNSVAVIAFNIKGKKSEEVTATLNDCGFALRGGYHCAPLAHQKFGTSEIGAARISVGYFNTLTQAQQLCHAIKAIH